MKVLVIEDEKRLADILKKGLAENSFTVDLCHDGAEGLYMAETYPYDAVLLDITLPIKDGLTLLSELRAKRLEVPVLIITARGTVADRIKALGIGADDYISKPFNFAELLARLRSVIRRSKGRSSPVIDVDNLSIDTSRRTVSRAGREIRLSATEYGIIEYLAFNIGRVLSRTELIEHIYDTGSDRDSNVIDVYINHLRNKIDKGFGSSTIHTVRGAGYMMKDSREEGP
jgi:DNA-binding response OmpR family regulator